MEVAVWREIQSLRAEPTGLAARDADRKKVFRSALRQAEELAEAADSVSYAARPILLFYALSQASRAIAAACLQHPWMVRNHGLECRSAGANVLRATVEPTGGAQGAYHAVTTSLASEALAGKTQLGALWSANPDLLSVPIRGDYGRWSTPLSCHLGVRTIDPATQLTTGGRIVALIDVAGATAEQVAANLLSYPTLTGAAALGPDGERFAEPGDAVVRTEVTPDGLPAVAIAKVAPMHTTVGEYEYLQDSMYSVVEVDARFPLVPTPSLVGHALPFVAGGPSPQPLLLWWALLHGLSSLARYEPSVWTTAIDFDSSTLAADLRAVIDIAAEKVPKRIPDSVTHAARRTP